MTPYSEKQLLVVHARVLRQHAKIVSGAYKTREVYHGTVESEGARFTEAELLQDEVECMDRHIAFMQQCLDQE